MQIEKPLVTARRSPKAQELLRRILRHHFTRAAVADTDDEPVRSLVSARLDRDVAVAMGECGSALELVLEPARGRGMGYGRGGLWVMVGAAGRGPGAGGGL